MHVKVFLMRHISKLITITFFVILFFVSPVVAFATQPSNVILPKEQVIDRDYFAAGETVTVSGTVNGDAYVAGGNVIIEGNINGDLLTAGGTVVIRGKVSEDVRAAGGQVTITGEVGRNVTVVGGSISIPDSADINGSLTIAGGNIAVFSPINKSIMMGAGQATLGNTVNGDVQAGVGMLSLTPNASIAGNLTYWSESEAQMSSRGQVTGNLVRHVVQRVEPKKQPVSPAGIIGIGIIFSAVSFASALVIGLLLAYLFPTYLTRTASVVTTKTLQSFGVGIVAFVAIPVVLVLLLISIIGIPIGLILLASTILFAYLSKIFIATAIGLKIMQSRKKIGLGWVVTIGLVVYYVATLVPVIGALFWMVAGLTGFGAILIERTNAYKTFQKKETK